MPSLALAGTSSGEPQLGRRTPRGHRRTTWEEPGCSLLGEGEAPGEAGLPRGPAGGHPRPTWPAGVGQWTPRELEVQVDAGLGPSGAGRLAGPRGPECGDLRSPFGYLARSEHQTLQFVFQESGQRGVKGVGLRSESLWDGAWRPRGMSPLPPLAPGACCCLP